MLKVRYEEDMKKLNNSFITALLLLLMTSAIGGFALYVFSEAEKKAQDHPKEVAACLKQEAYKRIDCLIPYFTQKTTAQSPQASIEEATALLQEGAIDDCHLIAHEIGKAHQQNTANPAVAFSTCPMGCIEGCFHGVMEEYASGKSPELVFQEAPLLCAEVGSDALLYRQCLHGIGHGLFAHADGKLVAALDLCGNMPDASARAVCQGGVYMENINQYMTLRENELKNVLPSICDGLSDPSMCAVMIGEGLMFYTGHDLERSYRLCEELPDAMHKACQAGAKEEEATSQRSKNI